MKKQYIVISPDGFSIQPFNYKTKKEALLALNTWCKRYEAQGYYSTVSNGERVRIPLHELPIHCQIIIINKP